MAVTESVPLAITYDTEIRALIQRLARLRGDGADFVKTLTEEDIAIKQRLENEWEKTKEQRLLDNDPKGNKKGDKKGGKMGTEGWGGRGGRVLRRGRRANSNKNIPDGIRRDII